MTMESAFGVVHVSKKFSFTKPKMPSLKGFKEAQRIAINPGAKPQPGFNRQMRNPAQAGKDMTGNARALNTIEHGMAAGTMSRGDAIANARFAGNQLERRIRQVPGSTAKKKAINLMGKGTGGFQSGFRSTYRG